MIPGTCRNKKKCYNYKNVCVSTSAYISKVQSHFLNSRKEVGARTKLKKTFGKQSFRYLSKMKSGKKIFSQNYLHILKSTHFLVIIRDRKKLQMQLNHEKRMRLRKNFSSKHVLLSFFSTLYPRSYFENACCNRY